jgi:iron complex outermembrane recepter protein
MSRYTLLMLAAAGTCQAQTVAAEAPTRNAGIVTISAGRPSSLPTQIPTTIESITGAEVETKINATDAEDALRYFPSLLVRKRYVGDYNHAVLSSRASGTGNSARSMVYADGILLSNYLGNGAAFTPRWGLVTPEEIERVDVLYGPFSAAYPGNSVGAVVDYVTRMPQKFEAHAKLGAFVQPFELYGTKDTYGGWQTGASLGDRQGAWSWRLQLNRLDSRGQPLTFVSRSTAAAGAVPAQDRFGAPIYVTDAGTIYRTRQDQAKGKLAWDLLPGLRATALWADWRNTSDGHSESYLSGQRSDSSVEGLQHRMLGLTLQSRSGGAFDWSAAASAYGYQKDRARVPTAGGAGRVTDLKDTGWHTLVIKGVWRPGAEHQADFGVQQDSYRWRQRIDNTADWTSGDITTPVSSFRGDTQLRSLYAQDAWQVDTRWKAVLGARWEHWTASDGAKTTGTAAPVPFKDRAESWLSPKAALGFQVRDDWALKLSTGRAVRVPTVGELFQGNAGVDVVTNPSLKPEKSWTTELSSELTLAGTQRLRSTLFHENTTDALYSQAIAGTSPIVSSVQNIDRIRTVGLETAWDAPDLFFKGLDLQASATYADSVIKANSSYVLTPGDTIGKQQPRVPKWRAGLLASCRLTDAWTGSFGARYGSTQYGQLNNSDGNGFAYQGFSKYFTTDVRLRWKIDRQWSAAFGIDNLNNYQYWNFHPYPQRTYSAELRFDL